MIADAIRSKFYKGRKRFNGNPRILGDDLHDLARVACQPFARRLQTRPQRRYTASVSASLTASVSASLTAGVTASLTGSLSDSRRSGADAAEAMVIAAFLPDEGNFIKSVGENRPQPRSWRSSGRGDAGRARVETKSGAWGHTPSHRADQPNRASLTAARNARVFATPASVRRRSFIATPPSGRVSCLQPSGGVLLVVAF